MKTVISASLLIFFLFFPAYGEIASLKAGTADSKFHDQFNSNFIEHKRVVNLPEQVTLTSPLGKIDSTTPSFSWIRDDYSTWYKCWIGDGTGEKVFAQWYRVKDICPDENCSISPEVVLPAGDYQYYVLSWSKYASIWSEGLAFTIEKEIVLPSKITHIAPSGESQEPPSVYSWNEDSAATWYQFWVGSSNGDKMFAQWFEATTICADGSCSVTPELDLLNGDYEWYIKSWNSDGSIWSDGMAFSVQDGTSTEDNQISIASFKIQDFGDAKADLPDIMKVIADIISEFDIVAIQGIQGSSGTAVADLETIVDTLGADYSFVLSPMLGRTSVKEQYAYMYRTDKINYIESFSYDDAENDAFSMEPFIAGFKASNGAFDFVLITLKTDPDAATDEIESLPEVVLDAQNHFTGENDFIILGDLNADCGYFDEEDTISSMRTAEYTWLIDNSADTTLSETSCTFDRIIVTEGAAQQYNSNGGVFQFDLEYGLTKEVAASVSDHYPVYSNFNITVDAD